MQELFYSHLILIPGVAFIISVVVKWIFSILKSWKLDLAVALWSWWMPSAHTAVTVSITTALALKYWIWSDYFAIAMAFTVIIIYDAINVRFEAWLHAKAINKYIWEKRLRESLWHLPSEAFAWAILWMIVAITFFYL